MTPIVSLLVFITIIWSAEGASHDLKDSLETDTRIIGGYPASVGQFPWHVFVNAIFFETWGQRSVSCGGTLIATQWVLTTASCVRGAGQINIDLGGITRDEEEEGRVTVSTANYLFHPHHNDSNYYLYVALVYLLEPVELSDRIRPVRLPDFDETLPEDSTVVVSGFGIRNDSSVTVSDVLYYVELKTVSNLVCNGTFGDYYINDALICVVGTNTSSICSGDGGGALLLYEGESEPTIHGVAVFMHYLSCEMSLPLGFMRISSLRWWIYAVTGV